MHSLSKHSCCPELGLANNIGATVRNSLADMHLHEKLANAVTTNICVCVAWFI